MTGNFWKWAFWGGFVEILQFKGDFLFFQKHLPDIFQGCPVWPGQSPVWGEVAGDPSPSRPGNWGSSWWWWWGRWGWWSYQDVTSQEHLRNISSTPLVELHSGRISDCDDENCDCLPSLALICDLIIWSKANNNRHLLWRKLSILIKHRTFIIMQHYKIEVLNFQHWLSGLG